MSRYISFRDFDWLLFTFVLVICGLGVMEIHSATLHTKFAGAHIRQIYWILGGIAGMFLVSLVNYQKLLDRVHWLYIAAIVSLMSVMLFGQKYLGARRWIKLPGGAHFQPSEWVKLILILAVAKYFRRPAPERTLLAGFHEGGRNRAGAHAHGVAAARPGHQPHLLADRRSPVCFWAGFDFKQAAIVTIAAALLLPLAWHALKPYQRDRLTSFMHPEADSQGSGYQVNQSLIAVGSGGIWGNSEGSQTHLAFLPVPQTDFIFAAFAEEHGFVGALAVMLLYFIVLMRLTQNAQTAPDRAGTFVVMGVVAVLSFHIMVNVGMVVGFMPVTGIPLPLMSYGGSSVLFMFLALGIVMNVRMRRFVN